MKLKTLQYKSDSGWSIQQFPDLDSENTLIIAFCAPEFIGNKQPLAELRKQYPKSKIIGCSSAGEIAGARMLDHSMSIAIAKFEKTKIKIVKTKIDSPDKSYQAGENIIQQLKEPDLRGIYVLSDGLNINGSELVKGLNEINNPKIIISGGLAGDGERFKETWAIFDGEIETNLVVGVGFYGDAIRIGHGSRGGWDIFGPERLITKSKNNILYEVDGKPALALYKEYLGERAEGLPATGVLYPLAIRQSSSDTRQLVRTILAVNEENQSLTFAGDMPTGYLAQLMRANLDRVITAADEAGEVAAKIMGAENDKLGPVLALAVSCVGRRLLLGERTEEEIEATLQSLPFGSQQIGFYSYGELSPYDVGSCDLHNQTMTLTTVSEEDE